jgi:hypothetical protein
MTIHHATPPRSGLFAKALAHEVRGAADDCDDTHHTLAMTAAELEGLPRCTEIATVVELSRGLIAAARQLDDQSRAGPPRNSGCDAATDRSSGSAIPAR